MLSEWIEIQLLETVQCMEASQSSVLLTNSNVKTTMPVDMTVLSKKEAIYIYRGNVNQKCP